ncbi:MAG: hypothetical protein LBF38_04400 [Deltaproteobacteria bacterium]|jgi:hypothetical protein|nr:hypothetical protein [Deltaproteobacteria bacterium]
MGVLIVSGSPKKNRGASWRLGLALAESLKKLKLGSLPDGGEAQSGPSPPMALTGEGAASLIFSNGLSAPGLIENLKGKKALVFVLPLYVDALPSHLVDLMEGILGKIEGLPFYAVINCGFYEADKNLVAVEILKNFCREANLKWGQVLAFGGGGAINSLFGLKGFPFRGLNLELGKLAKNILAGASGPDLFAEPDFPKFVYKLGAHLQWYWMAFKNKVKFKDLYKKIDG